MKIINTRFYTLACTALLVALCGQVRAQSFSTTPSLLEPSATQYFQNQYLANPAMAGVDTGLHINAAYRRQWDNIDGAPVTKFVSADYRANERVGIGFHLFDDKAGLIQRTRAAITYAYRLPLSDHGQYLSFGLSGALNTQHINLTDLNGDPNDPSIGKFNRRDNYFEAEFGVAYTDTHWTLQAALPNVRSLFTGDDKSVDGGTTFFSAASYKFAFDNAVTAVEPKLAYRGVRGYDNILDAGVNVQFLHNVANVLAMYHTTKSFTGGVGVNIAKTLNLQVLYTSQTGGIKTYVDGTFEVGLTLNLFNK